MNRLPGQARAAEIRAATRHLRRPWVRLFVAAPIAAALFAAQLCGVLPVLVAVGAFAAALMVSR